MHQKVPASKRRIANLLPMILMMAAIFTVSNQPGDELHLPSVIGIDKLCHFIEYGFLAATCIYAFNPLKKDNASKVGITVIIICLLYAISDEIHQSFVPLRDSSVADIVADTAGAALVVLLWMKKGSPPQTLDNP